METGHYGWSTIFTYCKNVAIMGKCEKCDRVQRLKL